MSAPLVSVIMPVFNAAPFVEAAVRSVLAQTASDFELIAIDDASTDGSRDILARISDPRLRVLTNAGNLGAADAKNRGLAEARGEFVAFLDADDLALPHRFAIQLDWLRAHPDVGVLGTSIEHIDEAGRSLGRFDLAEPDPHALRARLLFRNRIAQSTVMLRRSALPPDPFREALEPAEDYDLWARLSTGTALAVLPDVLVRYRIHTRSVSATKASAMRRSVRAIQDAQLGALGVADAEGIHATITGEEPIASIEVLRAVERWLSTLRHANSAVRIYEPALFDAELRAQWLAACRRAERLGLAAWLAFRRSPFRTFDSCLLRRTFRHELARHFRPGR